MVTAYIDVTCYYVFYSLGHVLGRREGPPLTTPSTSKKVPVFVTTQSPHPQDSLSQATKSVEIGIKCCTYQCMCDHWL